jgi:hypothetical protein
MLLFIVIFFAVIIIVGVAAVYGFSFYLKRRTKSLTANNRAHFSESPPRILFEPDADELRAVDREIINRVSAKSAAEERLLKAEKAKAVRLFLEKWQTAPDKRTVAELLRVAARSDSAEIFSETAESVVEMWRSGRIENLTASDLADLLDSRFRLLSQQERTSGAIFWVKREIVKLRSRSEKIR